jgi:hypothetical protein
MWEEGRNAYLVPKIKAGLGYQVEGRSLVLIKKMDSAII